MNLKIFVNQVDMKPVKADCEFIQLIFLVAIYNSHINFYLTNFNKKSLENYYLMVFGIL